MYNAVGIDVSKGKSTVAVLQPAGVIIRKPFNVNHTSSELDDLAKLMGFPGKLGMDGSKVWAGFQAGQIKEIRDYCETDVVNTYLVLNRFRRMRGELTAEEERLEVEFVRGNLEKIGASHWREFLAAWKS